MQFKVSWVHRLPEDDSSLDLLTIGNLTYTTDPRVSANFRHPANWGLRIEELRPSDAGTYICQISTFPPRVNLVFLEIRGE